MSVHVLRTDSIWWDRIADGSKTAELRKHDRDFQPGDTLILVRQEWDRGPREEVEVIEATISHVLPSSVYSDGLHVGYSMLSIVGVGHRRFVPTNAEIIPASSAPRDPQ